MQQAGERSVQWGRRGGGRMGQRKRERESYTGGCNVKEAYRKEERTRGRVSDARILHLH